MKIEELHFENVRPAYWRVTHMLKPDMKTLLDSVLQHGWTAPIVVQKSTSIIIDGFSRWVVAQAKPVVKRDKGMIPVVSIDVNDIEAMIAHVRMNRAQGLCLPRKMARLINDVLRSGAYDEDSLRSELRMGTDEFSLLVDGTLFKQHNITEHKYSNAWVPIESNGKDIPVFERPPNPDS